MKQKKTPYQKYLDATELNFKALVKDYKTKVDKARNGRKVHNGFLNFARNEYQTIQTTLGKYNRFIIEINDELEDDKEKKFDVLFNQKFADIPDEDNGFVLNNLAQLRALDEMFSYLAREERKYPQLSNEKPQTLATTIKWKGGKVEFIHLIYSLHEAGYLENAEGKITKLVNQVASVFNFELGHWQSNLSDNVNNRNSDYQAKIFDKLAQAEIFDELAKAFAAYRETQIDNNKKKKLK